MLENILRPHDAGLRTETKTVSRDCAKAELLFNVRTAIGKNDAEPICTVMTNSIHLNETCYAAVAKLISIDISICADQTLDRDGPQASLSYEASYHTSSCVSTKRQAILVDYNQRKNNDLKP